MNDAGECVVTWVDNERDGAVYARTYRGDGSPVGSEILLSSFAITGGMAPLMNVDINDNGQYVAVWNADNIDGDDFGIFVQTGMVPEPTSLSLLMLGGLVSLICWRRRS